MIRKTSWRKWISLLASVSMSLTIIGCSTNSISQDKTSSAGEPVKLRIMWWGSQTRHDATLKVLKLYTKKHPNVIFVPEYSGWDGYWDKLAIESAADNAPDIIQMDAQYLKEYASRNQLADLSTGINVSDVDKALVDSGKYNGKLYAIPLGNNAYGMLYNKAALEKMGVPIPKPNWTWDDYFKLAREIQPKLEKGKYAIRDATYDEGLYEVYQLSKGKGHTATPEGKFNFDKNTWMEWEQTFAQLRKEHVVPPADIEVSDKQYDPKQDLLLNGTVLFRPIFAAEFPAYDNVKPGTFAFVKVPRSVQSGGYLKPSMFWSVNSRSEHIEEAKKFIDWFIHDKEAADILGTSRGIPVSGKITDYLQPKFNQTDKTELELIKETAPDANSFEGGPMGWGNFINQDYKKAAQELLFGNQTSEQVYQEIMKKFKETIKSN